MEKPRAPIERHLVKQGLVALLALVAVTQGCNLTGNPISARSATRKARRCLEEEFPHLRFEVKEANYDYKRQSYRVHIYQSGKHLGELEVMGGSLGSQQIERLRKKLENSNTQLEQKRLFRRRKMRQENNPLNGTPYRRP
jgi:hypothetical protein